MIMFIDVTQSIIKLASPDFACKKILSIPITADNNYDDDNDDSDDYSSNSVNFQARTSIFCMEVDLDNTYNMMMIMLMTMMMMM